LTGVTVRGNIKEVEEYKNKLIDIRHRAYFPYLILFLISGLIFIGALRHNNTTMVKLRNDVYVADKDNGNVEAALDKLRGYVYGHMNTDVSTANGIKPPIQLKYTYDRLAQQAQQAANNSQLYTTAENYCQEQIPASVSISGRGRIQCVTDYVLSHGGKAGATVPPALYQFDFISPSWSPDLAGWSLVATVFFGLMFIITLIRGYLIRHSYYK
jgi:hypothetical protein